MAKKHPGNDSLVAGETKAFDDASHEEITAALADARGNLGFHQIGGSQARIDEAEANVAYLEELQEKKANEGSK